MMALASSVILMLSAGLTPSFGEGEADMRVSLHLEGPSAPSHDIDLLGLDGFRKGPESVDSPGS